MELKYTRLSKKNVSTLRVVFALGLLFLGGNVATASSSPREYALFQFACVGVRTEPFDQAIQNIDRDKIEPETARQFASKLSTRGLTSPVEFGSKCLANNGPRVPNLILHFHFTFNRQLASVASGRVVGALILHVSFFGESQSPHEYPTTLFVCEPEKLTECKIAELSEYIERHVMPLVEVGKQRRR